MFERNSRSKKNDMKGLEPLLTLLMGNPFSNSENSHPPNSQATPARPHEKCSAFRVTDRSDDLRRSISQWKSSNNGLAPTKSHTFEQDMPQYRNVQQQKLSRICNLRTSRLNFILTINRTNKDSLPSPQLFRNVIHMSIPLLQFEWDLITDKTTELSVL